MMINPRLFKPTYTSIKDIRTRRKEYAPSVVLHSRVFKARRRFKTASEALNHSVRLIERWISLYDSWGRLQETAIAENAEMAPMAVQA